MRRSKLDAVKTNNSILSSDPQITVSRLNNGVDIALGETFFHLPDIMTVLRNGFLWIKCVEGGVLHKQMQQRPGKEKGRRSPVAFHLSHKCILRIHSFCIFSHVSVNRFVRAILACSSAIRLDGHVRSGHEQRFPDSVLEPGGSRSRRCK